LRKKTYGDVNLEAHCATAVIAVMVMLMIRVDYYKRVQKQGGGDKTNQQKRRNSPMFTVYIVFSHTAHSSTAAYYLIIKERRISLKT